MDATESARDGGSSPTAAVSWCSRGDEFIGANSDHRIWWFDDHPAGPAIAIADRSRDWIGTAQELTDTMQVLD